MQSESLHPRSHGLAHSNNTSSYPTPNPALTVRSVHFAESVDMPSSILSRSRPRNAPYPPYAPPSTAPSARSWVYPYNNHSEPTPLPPSPTDQLEPLPGSFHRQNALHNAILGDDDDVDDTDNTQPNTLGIDFGRHQTEAPPSKKKSIIGRVFRGVFAKDSNSNNDRKLKRKATTSYDTVQTLATYGDSSNSASNAGDPPGPSSVTLGLGHGHGYRVPHNVPTPIMEVPETEDQPSSPTPEVYRLSDNIPPLRSRARLPPATMTTNHRPKSVSRKPVDASAAAEAAAAAAEPVEDRTTVMIFDQSVSRAPTGGQTPPALSRQPSNNPEPPTANSLQPLRPVSFAPTHASIKDPATRRTSIASPVYPRSRQPSLNRGVGVPSQAPSASSIADFPPGPYPLHPTSRTTSAILQPLPTPLPLPHHHHHHHQTPTATNPDIPTEEQEEQEQEVEYAFSPPSSKRTLATTTTATSYSSFSDLSPFARFVRALYKMPWISHDRVTVDYHPDHGLLTDNKHSHHKNKHANPKKGKTKKRMATWYRSMLVSSGRNSANADLLGRGGRRRGRHHRDLDISLGAALAELGSPFAATKRRKGRTERSRRHHHHHHHHQRGHHSHSHSSRHHHHHRRTTTDDSIDSTQMTNTPLAPMSMYPYLPYFPQPQFGQQQQQHEFGTPAAYQTLFPTTATTATPFYVFQQPMTTVQAAGAAGDNHHNNNNDKTTNQPLEVGGEQVPGAFS